MKNSQKIEKNVNQVENVKKENLQEKNLTELNLSKFADKLKDVNIKVKNVKETIYRYPEGWTKDRINSDEGKKFRNKLRNRLKSFSNNIFVYTKSNNPEALKKEIDSFDSFYKEFYTLNDYSIRSITNSEKREKDIEFMIEIIKEVKKIK